LKRYEFSALVDALGCTDSKEVFRRLGMNPENAPRSRYVTEGMTERKADELAVRAGLHPFEVWPQMIEDSTVAERERWNAWKRRWRRTPKGRASTAAAAAKWRESCRDYVRAQNRANAARRRIEDPEGARAKDREWRARNRDRLNAKKRDRYRTDDLYRQKILDRQRAHNARRRADAGTVRTEDAA